MAYVEWRVRGAEIASCNCAWGCPCQFSALPTHGDCRAAVGMLIDDGHFGEVHLPGGKWGPMFPWPRPIHQAHGAGLAAIDPAASEAHGGPVLTCPSGAHALPAPP